MHTYSIVAAILVLTVAAFGCGGPRWHGEHGRYCQELDAEEIRIPWLRIEPTYEILVSQAPVQAWVDVAFSMLDSGRPAEVRVVDAYPKDAPEVYRTAAVVAVRKWHFCPADQVRFEYPETLTARICFSWSKGDCPAS